MTEKNYKPRSKEKQKISPMNILSSLEVKYSNPLKDVYVAALPIAGCAWIETTEGVVLIDTLLAVQVGNKVFEKIKGKIKYIIYTHGHLDHVGAAAAFIKDKPEIIANKYLPDRLDKYKMLEPHRIRITSQQFNLPELKSLGTFIYPTKTFLGEMTFKLGDKSFLLHTARGETDDVCWIYVPELNTAFIGDLMIGVFPNIGNPWKPTRFALDWAKTLEEIRALQPEYIFCNGASVMYKGKEALEALNANIEVIRSMHDQVVKYINEDMHITQMIHTVKIPEHLKKSRYLNPTYSRPEFFTYNTYRWYHGYFDGNPAHLLSSPEKLLMKEIFNLIGDSHKVLNRVRQLFDNAKSQLALEVLDILLQAQPENLEARKLRIELLEDLGAKDYCLMSRNTWYYFINQDKKFLKSKGIK
jgi:alkyl sulfatase BDS1-like metallo-beta-lactamase superfamily hydrolase